MAPPSLVLLTLVAAVLAPRFLVVDNVATAAGESLFDVEARKAAGPATSSQTGIAVPAKLEKSSVAPSGGEPVFDSTSSGSAPAATRTESVFSVRDPSKTARRDASLFDLEAGSSLVPTKTFPFISEELDKEDRVTSLLDETAAGSSSNKLFNRRRPSKTLFETQQQGKPSSDDVESASTELPAPRNFDIITFGPQGGGSNGHGNNQNGGLKRDEYLDNESNNGDDGARRAYAAQRDADARRRKAEETLKELEERIRLEERLSAARKLREEQEKEEARRKQREREERERHDDDRRYADEERRDKGILVRLTPRDGELFPSPSSSYDDSPPVYNQYYDGPQPQDVPPQPEARSYNVYPPQGPPQPPPYNSYNDEPSKQNYGRPSDSYQQGQGYGEGAAGDIDTYGRPAVIASNNPQGPVIHITLNQHLPGAEGADQQAQGAAGRPVGQGPEGAAPGVPAQSDFISPPAGPPGIPLASPPGFAAGPPGAQQTPPSAVGPPLNVPGQQPFQSPPQFGQQQPFQSPPQFGQQQPFQSPPQFGQQPFQSPPQFGQQPFQSPFGPQVPFASPPFPFQSPIPTNQQVSWVTVPIVSSVPQQPQASPPFNAPPAAAPTPATTEAPQQRPLVVVVQPGKKKGYGDHGDSYDDHSAIGVKVVKGDYDNSEETGHVHKDDHRSYNSRNNNNSNNKGRSLTYTIRIPEERSVSYGKDVRRQSSSNFYGSQQPPSSRRPTTIISRTAKSSDIYTSGSKPKEIFLDITPEGAVRSSSTRRTKRSIHTVNTKGDAAADDAGEDVHYFFHIQHDVVSNDEPQPSGNNYGRRDYSVPVTRPLPPRPPVAPVAPPAPPAPPASDQPFPVQRPVQQDQPAPVQFAQAAVVPFSVVQAAPVVLAAPVVQQSPPAAFNIPVRLSLAPKPSATVHHFYVPKKKKFKKLKKGWMWF